jgi:hypothetical protein
MTGYAAESENMAGATTNKSDYDTSARPASLHWGPPAPGDEGEMYGIVGRKSF